MMSLTRTRFIILGSVIIGSVPTLFGNYYFGISDHLEQLPLIFRALDPTYLANDYFVNANAGYGPRYYFTHLMAAFAQVVPLHWVYLVLHLVTQVGVAAVTIRISYRFSASDMAALLAAVCTTTLPGFSFGLSGHLSLYYFVPNYFVLPGCLLMFYYALQERIWSITLCAALLALIHPLMGAECGVLALLMIVGKRLFQRVQVKEFLQPGAAIISLFLFMFVVWIFPSQTFEMSETAFKQLVDIRLAHHYIPSTFPNREYLGLGLFVSALFACAAVLLRTGDKLSPSKALDNESLRADLCAVLLLVIMVMGLFVCGYLFTEIWFSKTWASAQVYRLSFVIKWVTYLLAPATLLVAWHAASSLTASKQRNLAQLGCIASALVIAHFCGARGGTLLYALSSAILSVPLLLGRRYRPLIIGSCAVLIILALNTILVSQNRFVPQLEKYQIEIAPKLLMERIHYPYVGLAKAMAKHIDQIETTLVPFESGVLRILSERPLYGDFKMLCYKEDCINEWARRVRALTGPTQARGFALLDHLSRAYYFITDSGLLELHRQFGISFAVLHVRTPTQYPVLFQDRWFKLIKVAP